MNLFLDTSAVVKLYHDEEGTEKLTRFVSKHAENLFLSVSDLTAIEIHSALLKRVRQREIGRETAQNIFLEIENDFQSYNVITVDETVKQSSVRLIDALGVYYNLRTLDALQLASALVANSFSMVDFFVSSDKNLLSAAELFFAVKNPTTM